MKYGLYVKQCTEYLYCLGDTAASVKVCQVIYRKGVAGVKLVVFQPAYDLVHALAGLLELQCIPYIESLSARCGERVDDLYPGSGELGKYFFGCDH